MKFVIVSTRQSGGGPIVLHLLCQELNKNKIDARVLYCPGNISESGDSRLEFFKKYFIFTIKDFIKKVICIVEGFIKEKQDVRYYDYFYEAVKGCKRQWFPFVKDNDIVIYPDICYGNMLNAKNVVRWLLYYNRFPNDKDAYGMNDLFFCYRDIFNDSQLNPQCNTLCLQNFDFDLYKQTNFDERSGCCYIIRKGVNRSDLPKNYDGPILDKMKEIDKVKAFNRYKYCYFYDLQTFYTVIAAVCGCIPIIVLEPGKTKDDYIGKNENPIGVAYGNSEKEIQYALETRDKSIQYLKEFDEMNKNAVANFINVCREHFTI